MGFIPILMGIRKWLGICFCSRGEEEEEGETPANRSRDEDSFVVHEGASMTSAGVRPVGLVNTETGQVRSHAYGWGS